MSRVLVDLATCHQMSRKVTELGLVDHLDQLRPTGGRRGTSCGGIPTLVLTLRLNPKLRTWSKRQIILVPSQWRICGNYVKYTLKSKQIYTSGVSLCQF